MQGNRNKVATPFPILISCADFERGGEVPTWFDSLEFPDDEYKSLPGLTVRRLTQDDLAEANLKRVLGSARLKHLKALRKLSHGFDRRDSDLIAASGKQLKDALMSLWDERVSEAKDSDNRLCSDTLHSIKKLGGGSLSLFGFEPGREMEAAAKALGYNLGPRSQTDMRWALSTQISRELCNVQPVLWWNNSRFLPAFYCEEPGAAFYAQLFMEIKVDGKFWDVCLHCGKFFLKRRSNQDYCCPAHGAHHRVVRWRSKKKQQSKNKAPIHRRKHSKRRVRPKD
jgi:hypothetical protein